MAILLLPVAAVIATATIVFGAHSLWQRFFPTKSTLPISVNYHFTRRCNYSCGFCFHTETSSYMAEWDDVQRALKLLKDAGMKKINFAGSEPFLYPNRLGKMVRYCKEELKLESVSIVSNGSMIRESWFKQYAPYVDILAISCDSFDEEVNIKIGRGKGTHIEQLYPIRDWCATYNILFKLNSVILSYNYTEDMDMAIARLQPYRWKCFQVLIVAGENDSDKTLRNAKDMTITAEQFKTFCAKHSHHACFIPEPNHLMAKSYLILDEYLRFLDRTGKQPSRPITKVGMQKALDSIFWDEAGFVERGGLYAWNKQQIEQGKDCGGGQPAGDMEDFSTTRV